jgi:hypothetical protein
MPWSSGKSISCFTAFPQNRSLLLKAFSASWISGCHGFFSIPILLELLRDNFWAALCLLTHFSPGRYNCVGKNLGLMEIRVAISLLVTEFDFDFAAGENGKRMFDEMGDYFTTVPGPLNLVFKMRTDK